MIISKDMWSVFELAHDHEKYLLLYTHNFYESSPQIEVVQAERMMFMRQITFYWLSIINLYD